MNSEVNALVRKIEEKLVKSIPGLVPEYTCRLDSDDIFSNLMDPRGHDRSCIHTVHDPSPLDYGRSLRLGADNRVSILTIGEDPDLSAYGRFTEFVRPFAKELVRVVQMWKDSPYREELQYTEVKFVLDRADDYDWEAPHGEAEEKADQLVIEDAKSLFTEALESIPGGSEITDDWHRGWTIEWGYGNNRCPACDQQAFEREEEWKRLFRPFSSPSPSTSPAPSQA
jgi:hypothetical protein